jgi:DNA-directed RNA polymerase subunit RPC12/RpoP
MKNCIQCGKEFQESEVRTGHEQKYCSSSCRMKAANKRREEKLINTYKNEPTQQPTAIAELPVLQRQEYKPNIGRDISITDFLAVLQETNNARIEATTERLKREYAEQKLLELQSELEEDNNAAVGGFDFNKAFEIGAPLVLPILGGTFQKILDREDVITRVQDLIAGVKK